VNESLALTLSKDDKARALAWFISEWFWLAGCELWRLPATLRRNPDFTLTPGAPFWVFSHLFD
jgi:hypothetical protein